MTAPIKVLIVDDSATARQMLTYVIGQAPDLRVVGEAHDGQQAVSMTEELRPDVILMDLAMPHLGGLEATREIMHRTPTPIVVTSASLENSETQIAFQAIGAGALTAIQKPVGPYSPAHADQVSTLLSTLRAMAGVAVIHRWMRKEPTLHAPPGQPVQASLLAVPQIVGIVSSTGGPAALAEIARRLPEGFSLPIVVVQHIALDFVPSLRVWLSSVTPLKVVIAEADATPRPGHIYLAPGNAHLTINALERFVLTPDRGNEAHMPSGNVLLSSLARTYQAQAVGVILTGMGGDGAGGLQMMYDSGAFTIAQDEASSVVYGMPREAVQLGAVRRVLPLLSIPEMLVSLTGLGAIHEYKAAHLNR